MHDGNMNDACPRCDWQPTLPNPDSHSHCPVCDYPLTVSLTSDYKAPTKASGSAPANVANVKCKKCLFVQPEGSRACNRCGLLFSVARRLPSTQVFDGLPDSPLSDTLRAQWKNIADATADTTAHHKFIDLCAARGHIQFAGYCYRTALSQSQDDAVIRHLHDYQALVIKRATAVMVASAPSESGSRLTHQLIMLSIGALLILGLAFLYFKWSQSSALLQGVP